MIKEAYVSYEVAKLLKEKGFDEECFGAYTETNHNITMFTGQIKNSEYGIAMYTAPTHQMACAWLREVHHIHIDIIIEGNGSCITYLTKIRPFKIIYPVRNYDSIDTNKVFRCNSYEEAVETALKYSLENLI